jgi:glycolate oxidase iron-sulfur subunit
MKALATGQIEPTDTGDRHLDHCLGCRRCESVCPAGVEYGALLTGTRAAQSGRRSLAAATRFGLALLGRPRLLDTLLIIYRQGFRLLPRRLRLLPRPPLPEPVSLLAVANEKVAVFVGCIARSYEAPAREGLKRLLAALDVEAILPDTQACCGAAALHAGDAKKAQSLAAQNRAAFAGRGPVLCLASGCQETLAASLGDDTQLQDACAYIEARGDRLRFRSAAGHRVALHLPCTQRSVTRTDAALRRLLARVPDLVLIELPDTGCCGAAGLHMLEEPERAAALRAPILQSLANCGAQELLSANIGCRLHLGNAATVPIRHPLEFLAEHLA